MTFSIRTFLYLLLLQLNLHSIRTLTFPAMSSECTKVKYILSDGVRYVSPYVQEYVTYAKGRWLGRELLEVLTREFGSHPQVYWDNAIRCGHVRINNNVVTNSYVIRNSDALLHRTHRHEPPVFGNITYVGETEKYFAVCKPPSLPMHPCGAYRYNTLEYILKNDPLSETQPSLNLVHRLDRVTSGLVVMAKTKEYAAALSQDIREKSTEKIYLARVKGSFPMRLDHLQRLQFVSLERFSGDQASSSSSSWIKPQNSKRKLNEGECMEAVNEIGFPIICKSKCYDEAEKEAEKSQEYIGYCYTDKTPAEVHRSTTGENKLIGLSTASVKTLSDQYFCLSYPIDVVSHRDGVYECSRDECRPYTGRTHQLRLHLQLLGNPIANDPCYGGKLFFDDPERKMRALRLLHDMKQQGIVPLSKVPHLDDEEIDSFIDSSMNKPTISSNDSAVTNVGAQTKLDLTDQKEGETDHDFLIRTCRYCKENSSLHLEHLLHCDGIWLHALQYSGKGWSFRSPYPAWAKAFIPDNSIDDA